MSSLRTVHVTRYVTPLREGGSLPAIIEADDDGLYVLKFRGAGQGPRALIAELVSRRTGAGARPARAGTGAGRPGSRSGADRTRSGDPGIDPGERGSQPRARLPARIGGFRSGCRPVSTPTLASAGGLVRRVHEQRRSHRAQHQPADVAPPPVADRPRRQPVLPSRYTGRRRSRRGATTRFRASASTCCSRSASAIATPTQRLAPRLSDEVIEAVTALHPRRLAG